MARTLYSKKCQICDSAFFVNRLYLVRRSKYCSRVCFHIALGKANKGRVRGNMSAELKQKHREGALRAGCGKWMSTKTGINANSYIDGRSLNGQAAREGARRRKLKLRNTPGNHTQKEWEAVKERWKMCLCCKKEEPEIKLTRDHVVSLLNGGSDDIYNIQPLCLKCNIKKSWLNIDFRYLLNL